MIRDRYVKGLVAQAEFNRDMIRVIGPHFQCKVQIFGWQLEQIEKNMLEMVRQINEMERNLIRIEDTYNGLTEDDQLYFDHIDIRGLREQQRARVEALRHVIETKMPNVKGINFLQLEPAEKPI